MTGPSGSTPSTGHTGVVLAGGYSQRFGATDKALATVDGRPLLARVVDRVGRAVEAVVVSCRADQREAFERALDDPDVRFALDPVDDRGPLAGLATGLATADADVAAVAPCDVPWVAPAFVAALLDRADAGVAAVPRADGRLQPALAAYPVGEATAACRSALADGRRDLGAVTERVPVEAVPASDLPGGDCSLVDVDTPADLRRLADRCGVDAVDPR